MKKPVIITALLTCAALVFSTVSPALVVAQGPQGQQGGGQALEIAPPVINLTANPGQVIRTEISIRDVSTGKLVVTNEINDFVAAGEDGTPKILLNEDEESPYSMKDWFSPIPRLTLNPQQVREVPVTIRVPANAAPGGYYSVIRFTGTPPELEGTGVSLAASLGSLVLLRVNGEIKEELSIEEFTVTQPGVNVATAVFEGAPLQFNQRIRNSGSVHEQPSGLVTIRDMFGNKVANVGVNQPPRNILPSSVRKFTQNFDSSVIGNKMLFGRYTADVEIKYGPNNSLTAVASTSFWVIPYKLIGGAILGLIILFFGLRYLLRSYNRRIISKATGAPKKKK